MRLLVVNPNTTQAMTDEIGRQARRYARDGTEIEAVSPPWGPASIEGHAEEELEALQEQLAQLEAWAAKAQQARKLDDAKTLRASAEEVAREVRRRQTVLRGAGRLK